ncbi:MULTISPECIES: phage tail protein [unclassified Pseudomonas]|uniref:phage tail protein n=1 Tax=unclassified Pseudomonas TaxID=196821 RepID=UPI002097C6B1|nr:MULTISPECIES: phage tail protein [unclassified Pseudomonas]MCO7518773.1 phage tail protein [Pseudomonas sp. 1]MCO7540792.1 phage tail protein [Pseudomonas sp. VA159-2]
MVDQNSQFYAILTNVGAAKQANADALGIPWKITQMGVGDASGADPTPNATQTSLINEWRRAPLNQLKVDDKNSAIIVAEQVIPADVGGKWIREIALYDADGDMVAVANCAPTYKPLLSQGSGRTQVVRMNLVVSSASNVQLKIDPSVVLATREWVTEELARQDFKHSVQVATTAPISLSGLQTIDGVAVQAGTRVLVKDQTSAKDNGLYQVGSGPWARSRDADSDAKVTSGLLVLVEKGTFNGDSAWQLVSDGPTTLGVSAQNYEMAFGRSGVSAGTYRSVTVDKYGRVIAATTPTTVAGYGLTDVYTRGQVDAALALKAPLDSPALTGTPTVPTAVSGSNSQQIASTAFVQARGQQFSGVAAFNAPGPVSGTPEHLGGIVHFWGTSAQSYSVPSVASAGVGPGACVRIHNWGTHPLSIVPQGADKIQETLTSGYSSVARVIASDTYVDVLHIGGGLWSMFGPGVEPVTLPWSRTLATNGYSRMPNGLILQWGRGVINASTGRAAVVFPTKFPNTVHSITGCHWGGGGAMFIVDESATVTPSGFTTVVTEKPGSISLGATYGFAWQAIGS